MTSPGKALVLDKSRSKAVTYMVVRVLTAAGFMGLKVKSSRIDGVPGFAVYVTNMDFAKSGQTRIEVIRLKETQLRRDVLDADEWATEFPSVVLVQPTRDKEAKNSLVTLRLPAFARLLADAHEGRKIKEAEDARNRDD